MTVDNSSVFVITGASRGLGLGLVSELLARGNRVIAGVRNPEKAELLTPLHEEYGEKLWVMPLDVSDSASIKEAAALVAQKVPAIDVLINNAGIGSAGGRISEETEEAMTTVFKTNTLGPLLTTQAFLPLLRKGHKKQIVNISSGLGSIQSLKSGLQAEPLPAILTRALAYKSSKAALNMQTVALAADLKDEHFCVICMCPGHVGTDMGNAGADRFGVPRPALQVPTSVAGQLKIIEGLTPEKTGTYINYAGEVLPF